jgi:peptide/nickel transport system substrate-binding protein
MKKIMVAILIAFMMLGIGTAQRILRLDNSAPGELDPHKANDYSGSVLAYNIYDTLVMPDPKAGVAPHLATEWSVSDDGLSYTFTLRQGVKFHDGSELQADDIVFSYDRVKAINQGFAFLFSEWVSSVEALDPYTVKFTLSGTYAPFLSTLVRLPIVNKDVVLANKQDGDFGDNGDYGQAFLSEKDAGSGAYTVASHNPQELTVLQKFPDYFLGFAEKAPDVVRQRYSVESATMRTLMARKEHEVSSQWHPQEVLKALAGEEGISLITEGGSGSLLFKLNTQRAPTDDVNFRKAMALAFDYDALISTLKITDAVSSGTPARGPIPAGVPGFDANLAMPKRDLEAAKAALAASKYANDLGSIEVDMAWVAEVPSEEKMALLFQQNMADLGVKVNITKVPWATLTERFAGADTTPNLYPLFTGLSYPDPDGLLYVMYSSKAPGTFWSSSWVNDADIDAMLDEARTTTDNAKRMELYAQIQQGLVDLQTDIFGYDSLAVFAKQNNVTVPTLETDGASVSVFGANWLFRLFEVE